MKGHPSQWIASGFTCRDLAARITDYLEERLSPLSRARCGLHLASCAHCRMYLKQMAFISDWARRLPAARPTAINRLRLRRYFAACHGSTRSPAISRY